MLLCWIFVQDTPSFYGLSLLSDRNVHLLPRSDSLYTCSLCSVLDLLFPCLLIKFDHVQYFILNLQSFLCIWTSNNRSNYWFYPQYVVMFVLLHIFVFIAQGQIIFSLRNSSSFSKVTCIIRQGQSAGGLQSAQFLTNWEGVEEESWLNLEAACLLFRGVVSICILLYHNRKEHSMDTFGDEYVPS